MISKENRDFVNSLIEYYISESGSYRQMAEDFAGTESVPDVAFGIIAGCVYSGFLQAYQNQQQTPGLEDVREFGEMLRKKAALIKKSILEPGGADADRKESKTGPESESPSQ